MSTSSITVQNEAGQVVSFGFDSEDPTSLARQEILAQRVARGELIKVAKTTKSTRPGTRRPVTDYQTGMVDEKGDLLKSVHGGGLDPDATGDALGVPSGSTAVEGAVQLGTPEPIGDSHPDAAAIEQPSDALVGTGSEGDTQPAKRTRRSPASGASE